MFWGHRPATRDDDPVRTSDAIARWKTRAPTPTGSADFLWGVFRQPPDEDLPSPRAFPHRALENALSRPQLGARTFQSANLHQNADPL
jgi:hypothetical protein